MEDAERGRGRNSLLASCVHLYFTALSISSSVAAARHTQIKREREMESERALLQVTVAGLWPRSL